jgi:hypothetical protein
MDANFKFLRVDEDIKQLHKDIWKKKTSPLFVLGVKTEHFYQTGGTVLLML